jgi:hypothetical protein
VLRLLCVGILMHVALPAAAEQRIIQSGLTKPFPAIGDAVVGCRDPADTVHWIEIITGKTWEREIIQDGQRQICIRLFETWRLEYEDSSTRILAPTTVGVTTMGMRSRSRLTAAGMRLK